MRFLNSFLGLSMTLLLVSCSGGGDDPTPTPQPEVPAPLATTLVFPANNEECNEGAIISDTESQVVFQWAASENTDSYTLKLKDLELGSEITLNTTNTQLPVDILRGNAYAWSVVSKANGTNQTAESDTWRFYNAGPGVQNYAPFPAYDPTPAMGVAIAAGEITLGWKSSDLDGDPLSFTVYLDTTSPPLTLLGQTNTNSYTTTINANTIYYWRVVASDSAGNSSQSEIFEFRTNP